MSVPTSHPFRHCITVHATHRCSNITSVFSCRSCFFSSQELLQGVELACPMRPNRLHPLGQGQAQAPTPQTWPQHSRAPARALQPVWPQVQVREQLRPMRPTRLPELQQ